VRVGCAERCEECHNSNGEAAGRPFVKIRGKNIRGGKPNPPISVFQYKSWVERELLY